MQTALLFSALLMGLAGGPHCIAMCAAPCAGVIRLAQPQALAGVAIVPLHTAAPVWLHAGRIAGYAGAGAVVAAAAGTLAWAGAHVSLLRVLWMLLHVAVAVWGALLLFSGRQPIWGRRVGKALAQRLRPLVARPFGVFAAGALWFTMPCGLLYSALMMASLANGPAQGALMMALFAVGSGLSLLAAPWLFQRASVGAARWGQAWGTRVGGLLLLAVAGQALWMGLLHQIEAWCA